MTTAKRRARRGFSLLEVLVALAIASVGLLAMIPLFAQASWGTRSGREVTEATTLARKYVDQARNTPYSILGSTAGCVAGTCAPPAAEAAANAPFQVTWTVTGADGTAYPFGTPPSPDIKRVTVTVVCASCARAPLRVQMTTLVSSRS